MLVQASSELQNYKGHGALPARRTHDKWDQSSPRTRVSWSTLGARSRSTRGTFEQGLMCMCGVGQSDADVQGHLRII